MREWERAYFTLGGTDLLVSNLERFGELVAPMLVVHLAVAEELLCAAHYVYGERRNTRGPKKLPTPAKKRINDRGVWRLSRSRSRGLCWWWRGREREYQTGLAGRLTIVDIHLGGPSLWRAVFFVL